MPAHVCQSWGAQNLRVVLTDLPKPMVLIGKKPILKHIMDIYQNQNFNEFIVASGYKHEKVVEYFKSLLNENKKIEFDYSKGQIKEDKILKNLKVDIVFTGELTMTGGRVKSIIGNIIGSRIGSRMEVKHAEQEVEQEVEQAEHKVELEVEI